MTKNDLNEKYGFKNKPSRGKTFKSIHHLAYFCEQNYDNPILMDAIEKGIAVLASRNQLPKYYYPGQSPQYWFSLGSTFMVFDYPKTNNFTRSSKIIRLCDLELDNDELGGMFVQYNDFVDSFVDEMKEKDYDVSLPCFHIKINDGFLLELAELEKL